jgi:glycerol uptake facilitator protein
MFSIRQRALAEVFGTAALVLVGPGSVIATLALAGKAVPAVTEADLLGISFAFGFIITALVYAIGKVSGCHINPAVTFALAATRRFPWGEVPVYWAAQFVGAVVGAFAIWGVFGQNAVTFGMGQTHFAADASTSYYMQAAIAEFLGTGLLLLAIMGIVDGRSPQQLAGLVIGGAVVGIILIFGPVTGASLNPARAFGPELVQTLAGGTTFWSQYLPVYLVPGLLGAAAATFAYDYLANPRLVERPIREALTEEPAGAAVS